MVDKRASSRLLSKIKKRSNGCWEWQGSKSERGYGRIFFDGKNQRAHRVSYMVYVGNIPKDMYVCHHCDNTSCVNPKHLFVGTSKDNNKDMLSKGRGTKSRGSDHHMTKLKEGDVKFIKSSKMPLIYLQEKFGVSKSCICAIRRKETWRHVV